MVEITITPMETGEPITMNPIIKLTPTHGATGTEVIIRGVKFEYNKLVVIFFDNDTVKSGKSDNIGAFEIPIIIPATSEKGNHTITVIQGIRKAQAIFVVEPLIELSPSSGPPGTLVTVSGTQFEQDAEVDIVFENVVQDTQTVQYPNGGFIGSFTVPESECCERLVEIKQDEVTLASNTFIVTPTIAVTPNTGDIGTTVTVVGHGFNMDAMEDNSVQIFLDDQVEITDTTPTPVETDEMGSFECTFDIPAETVNGVHQITAAEGINKAEVDFTVTSDVTADITLNPTLGPAETNVTVTGTDFDADSDVTIELVNDQMDTTPSTVTTDENGDFTCNFDIPAGTPIGTYKIYATTNEFNKANKDFVVTPS